MYWNIQSLHPTTGKEESQERLVTISKVTIKGETVEYNICDDEGDKIATGIVEGALKRQSYHRSRAAGSEEKSNVDTTTQTE